MGADDEHGPMSSLRQQEVLDTVSERKKATRRMSGVREQVCSGENSMGVTNTRILESRIRVLEEEVRVLRGMLYRVGSQQSVERECDGEHPLS